MSNKLRAVGRTREKTDTVSITLGDIFGSQNAFKQLSSQPLAARTSFKLAKLSKIIQSDTDSFDKARTALCERFSEGKIKPETGVYDIPEDKQADFKAEFDDLLKEEIEIPAHLKLDINEITVPITATDMLALTWLINE